MWRQVASYYLCLLLDCNVSAALPICLKMYEETIEPQANLDSKDLTRFSRVQKHSSFQNLTIAFKKKSRCQILVELTC